MTSSLIKTRHSIWEIKEEEYRVRFEIRDSRGIIFSTRLDFDKAELIAESLTKYAVEAHEKIKEYELEEESGRPGYAIKLTPDLWLAFGVADSGDPCVTKQRKLAIIFDKELEAWKALAEARKFRPFSEAQVLYKSEFVEKGVESGV